jgi:hypothetical protein
MQAALNDDVERVRSAKSGPNEGEKAAIMIILDDNETWLRKAAVSSTDNVHNAVAEAFGRDSFDVKLVLFGQQPVLQDDSFHDHGIEVPLLPPCTRALLGVQPQECLLRPHTIFLCAGRRETTDPNAINKAADR